MFAQQILLPAFAVFSIAAAQSTGCSQATATINSQADATALASCTTFAGTILLPSTAAGVISIDGPQQVGGDFIVDNATALTSLSSSSISEITGIFHLDSLTVLSTLSFSELTSVGSIEWSALPVLQQLTFPSFIKKAKDVLITNTFLSSLEGINLDSVETLNINNNGRLTSFSTQVANITGLLNIEANGKSLAVEFPNLETAANMTFRNCSSISIPSLKTVNGSLGFYGNYIESLAAPNLTTLGSTTETNTGSFALVANGMLSNISFPQLSSIAGAFQIANNTKLYNISFPEVSQVGGAIDFAGNFSTPVLSGLKVVSGGFNMQSTSVIDCPSFDKLNGNVIQGVYDCVSATDDAQSGLGGTSTSSGSSAKPTSSKAAAVSYGISEAVAGLSALGGLLQMIL
ncbi:Protein ecm33 [Lachnellula occidentalis]|uniref:Protein ecm33 n=1 Tax=Lachnellula occidentalis TaxID=215460 RepID=A0A8H8S9C3_9HELO|nr:Protein ecm33 [Lachnellula occidentalis]